MSRKKKVIDRSKFAEKMSTYRMLWGYNDDYQLAAAKELNRRVWKRNGRLSRKRLLRLHSLLCEVDSGSLLAFTTSLGKLVWIDSLTEKRRIFEKRLCERIRQRSAKKKVRRGRPRRIRARRRCAMVKRQKGRKGNVVLPKFVTGFHMRPVSGSRFRKVVKHWVSRKHTKAQFGGLLFRLAMAMNVLCYRNVCITSEWEFWTVCFILRICGFWRSVAIADDLRDRFVSIAKKRGLYIVPPELLERMQSCCACSSSARYLGTPST